MKTVAVDFDGVIHKYSRGWQDGSIYDEPMEGAGSGLSALISEFAVFIHTTRQPSGVASWLNNRMGFPATWYEPCGSHCDQFCDKLRRFQVQQGGLLINWTEAFPEFWNEQGSLLVTNVKLPAVAYLDDRGIRFESWEQSLRDIERFTG